MQLEQIVSNYSAQQKRFCLVNGFKIQQAGGTTWQEIAFCLSPGHEYLVKLMSNGLSIDQAAACISFNMGVGANYFYEIAKIRSFKKLWSKIIKAYSPQHECTYNVKINVQIGHLNKSLSDPYTNLLRQTTEAMAASLSGVDSITVVPYDYYSTEKPTVLSKRMAINISTILKEESYFSKVVDPTGGSYSIETLSRIIGEKAWAYFQIMDDNGGIFESEVLQKLKTDITEKREQRISSFNAGKTVGIGMNKYPNPDAVSGEWIRITEYLGIDALVLEMELKLKSA